MLEPVLKVIQRVRHVIPVIFGLFGISIPCGLFFNNSDNLPKYLDKAFYYQTITMIILESFKALLDDICRTVDDTFAHQFHEYDQHFRSGHIELSSRKVPAHRAKSIVEVG